MASWGFGAVSRPPSLVVGAPGGGGWPGYAIYHIPWLLDTGTRVSRGGWAFALG